MSLPCCCCHLCPCSPGQGLSLQELHSKQFLAFSCPNRSYFHSKSFQNRNQQHPRAFTQPWGCRTGWGTGLGTGQDTGVTLGTVPAAPGTPELAERGVQPCSSPATLPSSRDDVCAGTWGRISFLWFWAPSWHVLDILECGKKGMGLAEKGEREKGEGAEAITEPYKTTPEQLYRFSPPQEHPDPIGSSEPPKPQP